VGYLDGWAARDVELLRMLLLLLSRIKACVLLLIGEYETVYLRMPNKVILRMDPVLRLALVAHLIQNCKECCA